jgi:hypothetical protein
MPIEVAKELVERYYRCIETYYPILGIQLIHETLHSVYSIPVGESGDVEVMVRLRLIISIALSLLGAQDQRLKIAANASFHEAVSGGVSGDLFVTPTISSFQLVLMMCIYVWLTPSAGNIWRLLGHASRMCLDMIEKYGSDKDGTEPAKVGVLYRSLYAIETRVAIAYGRPRQLPLGNELPFTSLDQDITSTSDLSGMMYDLARLKNRFYKDIIGIDTGPLANDGMLPNFPDLSWMDTCVIEIYSWLENWRTSVQNLQAQFADNKAINMEESLLHWGEFQQSEALLLAKKASDRREKIIITNDEEHRLCVRMIRNVEGLQKGSRDFLFPIMWTAMHSMFTAGTLIAQYMASEALPDLGDEQIFRSCLTMLESLEAGIERDCIGLSVCLRNIYDSYQLPKSLRD